MPVRERTKSTTRDAFLRGRLGVIRGGSAARRKRTDNAFLIGVPVIGSLACPFWFWGHAFTWIEMSAFVIGYIVIGLGVGIGLHRYFTHRSFVPKPWLAWCLGAAGSMACQGSLTRWVVDHRRHHARTDVCGDVHSPLVDSGCAEIRGVRGFLNAHLLWMFDDAVTDTKIFGKDLLVDPLFVFFERTHWLWPALSLLVPWLWGYTFGGITHAIGCLLFGGCFRITLFQNFVWAVNSVGHTRGYQTYDLADGSRNNAILAWATFGDGWHNNHHRFPRSAFHGLTDREADLNGSIIRLLERFGAIRDVVRRGHIGYESKACSVD